MNKIFSHLLGVYLLFCGFVSLCAIPLLRVNNPSSIVAWLGTLLLIVITYSYQKRSSNYIGIVIFFLSYHAFGVFQSIASYLPNRFDGLLFDIDNQIFGKSLPLYFEALYLTLPSDIAFWVSEFLAFCYLYLFTLQISSSIYWIKQDYPTALQQFNLGILLLFFIGFLSYFILPAQGPYLAYSQILNYPPRGGVITDFLVYSNEKMRVGIDVFPSLHVAFAVFIGGFYFIKKRWLLGWLLLPFNLGLILATQYFCYHYGIDVLAGALLAIFVLGWVTYLGNTNPKFSNGIH